MIEIPIWLLVLLSIGTAAALCMLFVVLGLLAIESRA